jgi:hypothetical protein
MDQPTASAWRYAAVVAAADGSLLGAKAKPSIDLDGDGIGDTVWRDTSTGTYVGWLLDSGGATKATRKLGGAVGNTIATIGDFDGDGVSDFVWRSTANATYSIRFFRADGTQRATAALGGGSAWQIEGSDDFDGDGRDDLVWRHGASGTSVIWLMDSGRVVGSAAVGGDLTWRLVSTSGRYDADGDGKAELLWRNGTTGATVLWLMDGLAKRSATAIGGDGRWEIAATGDFDRDGRSDVVWRDSVSGTAVLWQMNGPAAVASRIALSVGGALSASAWSIVVTVGAGSAGRTGILLRESTSGRTVAWWMEGVNVAAQASLTADGRFQVVRRPGRIVG